MSVLIIFIQKAIVQGICILYGALGEIMTEKSGNLNLGIPGIMYMGGISGLMGAFSTKRITPIPMPGGSSDLTFLCVCGCIPWRTDLQCPDDYAQSKPERNRSCPYYFRYRLRKLFRRFYFLACRRCRTDFRKGYRKRLYSQDSGII